MAKKKAAPKRRASRYQAPPKKPVPGWVWLAMGLVIGGFVVMLMKLEPGRDAGERRQAPGHPQDDDEERDAAHGAFTRPDLLFGYRAHVLPAALHVHLDYRNNNSGFLHL